MSIIPAVFGGRWQLVVRWAGAIADSQHSLIPTWPRPITMVRAATLTEVRVHSRDIPSTVKVNPARRLELKQQISMDALSPVTA